MFSIRLLSALISVLFIAGAAPLANAQGSSAPAGWSTSTTGSITTYQPDNLPSGKTFQMADRKSVV